jgi:excisionase family DNA binding protein
MKEKTYLTVRETCELIRTSRVTLHRMIRKGMVPSYKIGGKRLFNRKELLQWVKSQREGKKDLTSVSKKGG